MKEITERMEEVDLAVSAIIAEMNERLSDLGHADIVLTSVVERGAVRVSAGADEICDTIIGGRTCHVIDRVNRAVKRFVAKFEPVVSGAGESQDEAEAIACADNGDKPVSKYGEKKARRSGGDWASRIVSEVSDVVAHANARLREILADSMAFRMEEVEFSFVSDAVAFYVKSGRLPVCIVQRSGNVMKNVKTGVWKAFDSIKDAIEQRNRHLAEEAEVSASDGMEVDRDAADALVAAARSAVRASNMGMAMLADVGREVFGVEGDIIKLSGFAGGFVVSVADKAAFVARFPKVGNVRSIARTIDFTERHIDAIGDSVRGFLTEAKRKLDLMKEYGEIAQLQDEVNRRLRAVS